MPDMTYASLVDDLKRYTSRGQATDTAFVDQIPRIITKIEFKLARENKTLLTQTPVTGYLTLGNPLVQKPARWRDTCDFMIAVGVSFADSRILFKRPYQTLRLYRPDPAAVAATDPRFYADYDAYYWFLAPTPYRANPCEFIMDERVAPLSETNQTNIFTQQIPDLLLNACLEECDYYLQRWTTLQARQTVSDRSLASSLAENKDRISDKTQSVNNQ